MKGKKAVTQLERNSSDERMESLTVEQRESIRQRVQEGIADIEAGRYTEIVGRAGLRRFAEDVIARGRERLKLAQSQDN